MKFLRNKIPKSQDRLGREKRGLQSQFGGYSYYGKNNPRTSQSSKPSSRLKPDFWHKLPGRLAVIVIFLCLVYSLTLTNNPKIVLVGDDGSSAEQNLARSTDEYQQIASSELSKSIFNRTKLTINTKELDEKLQSNIPEAAKISTTLPLLGRNPVVYVQLAKPSIKLVSPDQGVFIVDEKGRAVLPAQELKSDSSDLLEVIDSSGIAPELGKPVLSEQYIIFLAQLRESLEKSGNTIKSVTIPALPNELHVYTTGDKYYIKFNINKDVKEQVGRYISTKNHTSKTNNPPKEYIDVRVDERVFVL